ncbi:single-stranded-DNA-specific exonuclease RecJ [Hoeflea poritis]|uniref:Single-stranded-DNA-specific exonuclease RecJ n=1 Tax=Hoeflea poritis TaxID=2993659 RepID=A0ABT4VVK9_9HYPH|nr:single-stranded-DNA-specific exonuclease RecJ [Hoeflea poritis]MDA4848744.1 single-stranded-DNA-specific exonuclease RecJ [Hoeflea poritis]
MEVSAAGREPAFLDVEESLSGQRWVQRLDPAGLNRALAIAQTHGMPDLIARVLAGRGIGGEEAATFLSPALRDLMPDPSSLQDMEKAASRLAEAISTGDRVAVFGDYDVDGAAASSLMKRFLDHFDTDCEIYIPDRIFEGYGPNPAAMDELVKRGAGLIVTVDCGSTSHAALERAQEHGIEVLVVDHHQIGTDRPPCVALVNPNRDDDLSGQGHLCAAGLVFLLLVATLRELRGRGDARTSSLDLLTMLDLVALATVCDVVPLKGLNRAYVVKGLMAARHMGNPGLAALMKVAGVDGPVTPYHLGFLIGPRINAGGRIGDAALGSRLLTLSDAVEAQQIAETLNRLNQERQAMEHAMLEQAEAEALAEIGKGEGPAVIVTESEGWHPGIVGIVAARLKEKFRRPAFAIAFDPSGKGTGSGRSIAGFDLGRMVREAVEKGIATKGGGHEMAAGLSVDRNAMAALRAFFDERAAVSVGALRAGQCVRVDGALAASGATLELLEQLEHAGPYGSGHPQPVFALPDHQLVDARVVGADHVKLRLTDAGGKALDAIAFRSAGTDLGKALMEGRGRRFHVAGTLSVNHWRGSRSVQLRVIDAAQPPT